MKNILKSWMWLALLCLSISELSAQELVVRKNIDDLTQTELEAYEHAWTILKERSEKNEYDTAGYKWQAWIHNKGSVKVPVNGQMLTARPGQCEHGTTKFLPWHRAELYYFEKILQSTDPDGISGPSTKNVSIPYWNFLLEPSGKRYPQVFEKTSVLYDAKREKNKSGATFSKDFIATMIYYYNWLDFGGGPALEPGFGFFELIVHNYMHNFVGGNMSDQSLAALDPLFYSYHAYIDLLFEHWINENGAKKITSEKYHLRGTQPSWVTKPPGYEAPESGPSMGRMKNFFDIEKLGHKYQVLKKDSLPSKKDIDGIIATYSNTGWNYTDHGKNAVSFLRRFMGEEYKLIKDTKYLSLSKIIDLSAFSKTNLVSDAEVVLLPKSGFMNKNYQVDIYLYPESEESGFLITDSKYRDRYLVQTYSVWGAGAHHTSVPAVAKIQIPINSILIGTSSESKWVVRLVASVETDKAVADLQVLIN